MDTRRLLLKSTIPFGGMSSPLQSRREEREEGEERDCDIV